MTRATPTNRSVVQIFCSKPEAEDAQRFQNTNTILHYNYAGNTLELVNRQLKPQAVAASEIYFACLSFGYIFLLN